MDASGTAVQQTWFTQVAGGGEHTLFALDTGDIYACGAGSKGQLGNATEEEVKEAVRRPSDEAIPKRIGVIKEALVHVSAGHSHSAAISAGGTLFTWGDPCDGRLGHGLVKNSTEISEFTDDVDGAQIFTTMWPQPVFFFKSNERRIKFVACGSDHTLSIDDNGVIYSWGLGNYGNLGHGNTKEQLKPKLIEQLKDTSVTFCAAGSKHSMAISHNGTVYTWGHGEKGRLGNGDRRGTLVPEVNKFLVDNNVRAVQGACGEAHTAIVSSNGSLYTFGAGSYGRLGHGEEIDAYLPRIVDTLQREEVFMAACGAFHTVILTTRGSLFSCGSGRYGQLGHDPYSDGTVPNVLEPTIIIESIETKYTLVACGTFHTVAVTSNKKVRTWGFAGSGRLGHPSQSAGGKFASRFFQDEMKPVTVSSLKAADLSGVLEIAQDSDSREKDLGKDGHGHNATISESGKDPSTIVRSLPLKAVRMVDCGEQHTIMLTQSGHVWTWGNNNEGQLGLLIKDSSRQYSPEPAQITQTFAVHRISFVAAGNKHSMAITDQGDMYTWGRGKEGQLGLGGIENKREPQIVPSLQGREVVYASGGDGMTAAIVVDGSVYTWGNGALGKLGQGRSTSNQSLPRMVRGALNHEVVVQISLGFEHAACVTSSGKLFTWGGGWFGRLGVGSTDNSYQPIQVTSLKYKKCIQVSCGAYHTLAVTDQGDLYSWGKVDHGLGLQMGNSQDAVSLPTRVDFFKQIQQNVRFAEAAYEHSLVITQHGLVYSFGKGKYGKLGAALSLFDDEAEQDSMLPLAVRDLYKTGKELNVGNEAWKTGRNETRSVRSYTNHCVCVTSGGDLYTWGNGGSGRLGHGNQKKEITPREVLLLPGISEEKRKTAMENIDATIKEAQLLKRSMPKTSLGLRHSELSVRRQQLGMFNENGKTVQIDERGSFNVITNDQKGVEQDLMSDPNRSANKPIAADDASQGAQNRSANKSVAADDTSRGSQNTSTNKSLAADDASRGAHKSSKGSLEDPVTVGEERRTGTNGKSESNFDGGDSGAQSVSLGPRKDDDHVFNREQVKAAASDADIVSKLERRGILNGDSAATLPQSMGGKSDGNEATAISSGGTGTTKSGGPEQEEDGTDQKDRQIVGNDIEDLSIVEEFQVLGQVPSAQFVQTKLEHEKPEYAENNLQKLTSFTERKQNVICSRLVSCEQLEDEINTAMYNVKWTVNAIIQAHDSGESGRWADPRPIHARRQQIPTSLVAQSGNLERIFSLFRVQPNYLLGIYNYFISAGRDETTNIQHSKRFVDLVFAVYGDLSVSFNENRFLILCNDILLIEIRRVAQLSNTNFSVFATKFTKANTVFGCLMKIYMLSPHIVRKANGGVRNPITTLMKTKGTNFDYNPNRVVAEIEHTQIPGDMSIEQLKRSYAHPQVHRTVDKRVDELAYFSREIFITITKSVEQLHTGVTWICGKLNKHLKSTFVDTRRENFDLLIGNFLMERLYGPMVTNPARYDVCTLPMTPEMSKNLKLVKITLTHLASHMPYDDDVPWIKPLSTEVEYNYRTARIWSTNILSGRTINMSADLVIDLYREHLRPPESSFDTVGLNILKYARYTLNKCVKVITHGKDDPMYKYILGLNGLTYEKEDEQAAMNFVAECNYSDDKEIGLALPEQHAINLRFHTRLMTTSGVEALQVPTDRSTTKCFERVEATQADGLITEVNDADSVEDILRSNIDANETSTEKSVERKKNVMTLYVDLRNGVPLPSYLATQDAVELSQGKLSNSKLLSDQQRAVREVIRTAENLSDVSDDPEKLRRALMRKIREQQMKDPDSRNWDMQTTLRVAYDHLKNLPGTMEQMLGAFILDINEREHVGDALIHEVRSLVRLEKDIKMFYQYLLKKRSTCAEYLKQIYSGFEDSQNEQVKRAIGDESSNSATISKKAIGKQGKNEIHDARVLIQQIQSVGKRASVEKLHLGKAGILRGSFSTFSYTLLVKKGAVVSIDLEEFKGEHKGLSSLPKATLRKSVDYTFASKHAGKFMVTTSYDKDFVIDMFDVKTEEVVKLNNAMIRTWIPFGSQSTFAVSKLLKILQELTMKQLLLDYHPQHS